MGKTEFSSAVKFKTTFDLTFNISNPKNITTTSVKFDVAIASNVAITEKGICYSYQTFLPTIEDDVKVSYGSGAGNFNVTLTGLQEYTYYCTRPYVIIDGKTYYGEVKDFFTGEQYIPTGKYMTMETEATSIYEIKLESAGDGLINWGDGTFDIFSSGNNQIFTHNYAGSSSHLITISGENITHLACGWNELTSLDVSNNPILTSLQCKVNQLISLDVSNNTVLTYLDCAYNQLMNLDVSNNTTLTYLDCSNNQLTNLDVNNNTALTDLDCSHNSLTSLDVSNNTLLTSLICDGSLLTNLDVSNNTALTSLSCDGGSLTSLDVNNNTALTYLNCRRNSLTSLDVSNNTALAGLDCSYNQLIATSLDALFGTLHSNDIGTEKKIAIYGNPGENTCNQSIATNKGWTILPNPGTEWACPP